MNNTKQLGKEIESTIAASRVPEDPVHAKNTVQWLCKLDPDSDETLQIAALGHDIKRAIEERKVVRREDFDDYDQFKAAHAANSAEILKDILVECGLEDETLIQQIYRDVNSFERRPCQALRSSTCPAHDPGRGTLRLPSAWVCRWCPAVPKPSRR